jgi:hypothetical protein
MAELAEHVRRNRAHWDQLAPKYVAGGEHGWAIGEPNWGIWSVAESEVRMFPDDLALLRFPCPAAGTRVERTITDYVLQSSEQTLREQGAQAMRLYPWANNAKGTKLTLR